MADTTRNLVRVEIIAQIFGVTVRRVQQITQEGVIETVAATENGRACRRYDLIPTVQRYIKHLSDKAYGKAHRTDKEIELREQTMEAQLKVKELEGRLKDLNLKIKNGKYISREEVLEDYITFFIAFKKFASGIPARVASALKGLIAAVEVRRLRRDLADDINAQLEAFVVAGVGPDEVKEHGKGKKTQAVSGDRVPAGGAEASAPAG